MRIKTACEFLQNLIGDCPFKIHRLLTDNGVSFTYRLMKGKRVPKRKHSFDKVCEENGIKHKLTKFRSPWTNGQVEVFNRLLKEQTTNRLLKGKRAPQRRHNFDKVGAENGIKHKLTKFRVFWRNGQVGVFNCLLKEHTTKKYFDEKVKEHVMSFVLLYNYQRKQKSLKYLTPYEKIIELYEKDKTCFNYNPHHKILGLNN